MARVYRVLNYIDELVEYSLENSKCNVKLLIQNVKTQQYQWNTLVIQALGLSFFVTECMHETAHEGLTSLKRMSRGNNRSRRSQQKVQQQTEVRLHFSNPVFEFDDSEKNEKEHFD